jgi:hypothetical protein
MGWRAICAGRWRSRGSRPGQESWRDCRAGRGATGGSKPSGISGAGRWDARVEVPAVVRSVPMVETMGPDSQRKSRSVRLGEAVSGKLSSSKTTCREMIKQFVERSRQ